MARINWGNVQGLVFLYGAAIFIGVMLYGNRLAEFDAEETKRQQAYYQDQYRELKWEYEYCLENSPQRLHMICSQEYSEDAAAVMW